MENNQTTSGHPVGCKCLMCMGICRMCGFGHRYILLRWLLGLLILIVVFWLGMKIGEFKGAFEGGYGMQRGMYFQQPMRNMYYRTTPQMMGNSGTMDMTGSGTPQMMPQ